MLLSFIYCILYILFIKVLVYIMTLTDIWNAIVLAVNNVGLVLFIILILINVVLWRIHPALGTLGTLFIFALLFGLITI